MFVALCAVAAPASAQALPAGPVRAFDGRLVASGEVTATFGARDRSAYFNYTDYEHNALRMLRIALSAAWRPTDRIAFVGELRSENVEYLRMFAAYVRIRPWRNRAFDVQAGRIPPAFGAFGRRAYGADNPLIGYPLAYQYLTSLRTDAVPATATDLLSMRARGWRSSFPVGSPERGPGLPLVSAFRWDTGVQARWTTGPLEITGSVTNGTLSNPLFLDDNGGKQVSGRVALRPSFGLVIGASAARGAWLSDRVTRALPRRSYAQRALGADVEYSRGHWIVRGELVWSEWDVPFAADHSVQPMRATGAWMEGRYRLTPRFFVAGRADRVGFSMIRGSLSGALPTAWEAPAARVEGALGCYVDRNLAARVGVQHNVRDAGRVQRRTFVTAQLAYWF